jgi:hypothetical protein
MFWKMREGVLIFAELPGAVLNSTQQKQPRSQALSSLDERFFI